MESKLDMPNRSIKHNSVISRYEYALIKMSNLTIYYNSYQSIPIVSIFLNIFIIKLVDAVNDFRTASN